MRFDGPVDPACPSCGSRDLRLDEPATPWDVTWQRCRACGLSWEPGSAPDVEVPLRSLGLEDALAAELLEDLVDVEADLNYDWLAAHRPPLYDQEG